MVLSLKDARARVENVPGFEGPQWKPAAHPSPEFDRFAGSSGAGQNPTRRAGTRPNPVRNTYREFNV
jgi:hypothetical protein